ncbi:uncharacterized protein LOC115314560, partial [Ixodes scapularis]|uniref:uncharacterized protein LOC115314560 n=1 Tax=Ixodes scapularis TaxID=6945 RepID=UPI001A9DF3D0
MPQKVIVFCQHHRTSAQACNEMCNRLNFAHTSVVHEIMRSAALKRSQCATRGGVGDKPLNDMEERVVGLLNVEAMIGIPGAFDIGVPVEVPNGEPFSLPLSGTPITSDAARPRSVDLVLSFDTTAEPSRPSSVRPRHTSQADNIPERPQGDADVHGAS